MLHGLLTQLFAHTTMTLDDVQYIASKHGIQIDASTEAKLTAMKDDEEITFNATFDNGMIFIFEI